MTQQWPHTSWCHRGAAGERGLEAGIWQLSFFFFFFFVLNLLSVLSKLQWQLSFYVYVTISAPLSYSDKQRIVGWCQCHGLFNFMLVISGHVWLSFCYFGMERWLNLAGLFCEQPVLPTGAGPLKFARRRTWIRCFFLYFAVVLIWQTLLKQNKKTKICSYKENLRGSKIV